MSGLTYSHGITYHCLPITFPKHSEIILVSFLFQVPALCANIAIRDFPLETNKAWSKTPYLNTTISSTEVKIPQSQIYWNDAKNDNS